MSETQDIYSKYAEKEKLLRPRYVRNADGGYYESALHKAVLLSMTDSKENTLTVVNGISENLFATKPEHTSAELSALVEVIKRNADDNTIVQRAFNCMEKVITAASMQTSPDGKTTIDNYFLIDLADLKERKPLFGSRIDNIFMEYQWLKETFWAFGENTPTNNSEEVANLAKGNIADDFPQISTHNTKDVNNRLTEIRQRVKIGQKNLSRIVKNAEQSGKQITKDLLANNKINRR